MQNDDSDEHVFFGGMKADATGSPSEDDLRRAYEVVLTNIRVMNGREESREEFLEGERRVVQNIRDQRLRSGWSQDQLANSMRLVGFEMHQSTIAKIESGKRPLRLAELFAFADAMSVPWSALLEGGRDIDIVPSDGMVPIDVFEQSVEELIVKREDIIAEIAYEVEERAKRYAELNSEIILRAAALARVAAQANRDAAAGDVDQARIQSLVDRWTELTLADAGRRSVYQERQPEMKRWHQEQRAQWDDDLARGEVMLREFKAWYRARQEDYGLDEISSVKLDNENWRVNHEIPDHVIQHIFFDEEQRMQPGFLTHLGLPTHEPDDAPPTDTDR